MRKRVPFVARLVLLAVLAAPASVAQLSLIAKSQGSEAVQAMLNAQRAIAVTSDGRLWSLVYFNDGLNNGEKSQFLRAYVSTDNGQTWSVGATVRTPGAVRGSLCTGNDGRTLHLAWQATNGNVGAGVYYAPFDTRQMQWAAADFELAKGGTNTDTQLLAPSIDVTRRGVIGVAYYTHRQGPWAGQLRVFDGKTWSPVQKVNVDTYGVQINLQAHGDDLHMSYRSNAGLYGIRYRRFDTNTMTWGGEGEIQVSQANPQGSPASSGNCLAVAPNGDIYVVYASGAANPGQGVIWLAYAAAGTYNFLTHTKVADDAPLQGGNFTYYHYTLALAADGRPHVLFSLLAETYAKLYFRLVTVNGQLGPQLQLAASVNDSFAWLCGSRVAPSKLAVLTTVADRSTTGGQAWFLARQAGAAVFHGAACQGKAAALPEMMARDLPGVGLTLNLDLSSLAANAPGVLFLGLADDKLGAIPLPIELSFLGAPTCWFAQDLVITAGFAADAQGKAALGLPLPNDPKIAGIPIYLQSLVVSIGANNGNVLLTNGVAAIAR